MVQTSCFGDVDLKRNRIGAWDLEVVLHDHVHHRFTNRSLSRLMFTKAQVSSEFPVIKKSIQETPEVGLNNQLCLNQFCPQRYSFLASDEDWTVL